MDITMCKGMKCPNKERCYRYKAKPDEFYQSYFVVTPYDYKRKLCEYFWENQEND